MYGSALVSNTLKAGHEVHENSQGHDLIAHMAVLFIRL